MTIFLLRSQSPSQARRQLQLKGLASRFLGGRGEDREQVTQATLRQSYTASMKRDGMKDPPIPFANQATLVRPRIKQVMQTD